MLEAPASRPSILVALVGLLAVSSGCFKAPSPAGPRCVAPARGLDASLPFDFAAGEPRIARYYAYHPAPLQPAWAYRLGWDELAGCLSSAAPSLPAPASASDILALGQVLATSIARRGNEITIQDLQLAREVPEALRPAGPVRASYYLGALLRCAEQVGLIARVGCEPVQERC